MKKNLLQFAAVLVLVCSALVYGQITYPLIDPTFEAKLENAVQVAPNQFEFDIVLYHTGGGTPWECQGAQIGLLFSAKIRNGGTLSGITIPGTSQMVPGQWPANPSLILLTSAQDTAVFRLAPKAALQPGDGTIISPTGTRLARFRISTTAPSFAVEDIIMRWSFSGPPRYPTKVSAWVDDGTGFIAAKEIQYNGTFTPVILHLVLPVELSSFTAEAQGRDVNLNWETKTETNSSHFQIERTLSSSEDWVKIGEVQAAGNSNSPKQYSFVDKKLNSGKYNYRLKMVDADGTSKYSDLVETEVSLPKEYALSQNYPNPFNPTTRIDYQLPFDSKVNLEIYGITGEKVATIINTELAAGYYTADINAAALNLASGMYIYRMSATNQAGQNFTQIKKFMLMK